MVTLLAKIAHGSTAEATRRDDDGRRNGSYVHYSNGGDGWRRVRLNTNEHIPGAPAEAAKADNLQNKQLFGQYKVVKKNEQ
jgi:hypothetical protein